MILNSLVTFVNSPRIFTYPFSSVKFFGLNATWLTLLAVATKLTGDLTSPMWSYTDNLTKISSTLFLTFAMANFFTSLSSMNNTDMLTNLTALGILVFTVVVNICIQLATGVLDFSLFPEIIFALVLLFFMFTTIVSSALAVPAIKKRVESKYQKLVKQMESEQQQHLHLLRVEELRLSITKHLVMAASCSPQFLMTRLVSFVFMTIICLFSVVILLIAIGRGGPKNWACHKQSDYKWSLGLIVYFQQFVGINFGPITTTFLICVAAEKEEFTVEPYWIENLVEWRQSPIPIRFKRDKVMKLLHNIKSMSLTFCILLQTLIVIFIKFSCVVSFYIWLPLAILVSHLWKLLFPVHEVSNDQRREEIDLNHFLILLEGEKQLPKRLLRKIIRGMNSHVKGGKNNNLIIYSIFSNKVSFIEVQ
nr:uncharacterized protein LOC109189663 [Ipomoea batatas]